MRNQSNKTGNVPPLPNEEGMVVKKVDRGPLALVPYLPRVFGQVMYNNRGVVGYDWKEDNFLLYLKIADEDRAACSVLSLSDVDEIWIALKGKEV
jgi:hypothetical protein